MITIILNIALSFQKCRRNRKGKYDGSNKERFMKYIISLMAKAVLKICCELIATHVQ